MHARLRHVAVDHPIAVPDIWPPDRIPSHVPITCALLLPLVARSIPRMRKKIELLKDHANFAADGIDCLLLVVDINAVNDDSPLLISLQVIDAADQRGFARS